MRRAVILALLGTLGLGLYLRWALTGRFALVGTFAHLRHAHSHLGVYGLLFPLAWAGWARAEAPTPGPRSALLYGAATLLAFIGFATEGYRVPAIVGSTLVGGVWLTTGWRLAPFLRQLRHPLAVVPFGVTASLACIPPIAMNLRTAPDVAHAWVATFLTTLQLVVLVPSMLAGERAQLVPWPALLLAGGLGSLALGAWSHPVSHVGLAAYASVLLVFGTRAALPLALRVSWVAVAAGLFGMATSLLPNTRPVAVGALHFLVLGALLPTLARHHAPLSGTALWALVSAAAGLSLPLVLQGLGAGLWTLTASAMGGTAFVVVTVVLIARSVSVLGMGKNLERPT